MIRDPKEVSLGEVMAVIEGRRESHDSSLTVRSPTSQALLQVWREVASTQRNMLASITLDELLEKVPEQNEEMYYI